MLDSRAKPAKKLAGLEAQYDAQFRVVFEALDIRLRINGGLMQPERAKRKTPNAEPNFAKAT